MKKILCLLISFVLLNSCYILVNAKEDKIIENISIIENNLSVDILEKTCVNLYDNSENIIAYYYKINPKGYIIISKTNFDVIEYSTSSCSFNINNKNKYYYNGPLLYYIKSDNNYVTDIKSGEKIHKSDLKSSINNISIKDSNLQSLIAEKNINSNQYSLSSTPSLYTKKLSGNTRVYSYNPDGRCGSVAASICFAYYYDFIDSRYVDSFLAYDSNGISLINYVSTFICNSATRTDVVNGMNSYLKAMRLSQNAKYSSGMKDNLKTIIENGKPCIIGLTNHPTYKNHWVVATGYQWYPAQNQSYGRYIVYVVINDGWGSNNININPLYIDNYAIYIS